MCFPGSVLFLPPSDHLLRVLGLQLGVSVLEPLLVNDDIVLYPLLVPVHLAHAVLVDNSQQIKRCSL